MALRNFHINAPRMNDKKFEPPKPSSEWMNRPFPMWTCPKCGIATEMEWREIHMGSHYREEELRMQRAVRDNGRQGFSSPRTGKDNPDAPHESPATNDPRREESARILRQPGNPGVDLPSDAGFLGQADT